MKTTLTEGKFLVYSTLAIVLLVGIHIFQTPLQRVYNPDNYVGFHTLLETFSISISAAIFLYGLKKFGKTRSSQVLLISFTFFLVGTFDLLHTLSFKGMPYFLTESSVPKATWFWVIARVTQSLFILAILLMPDRNLKRDYRTGAVLIGMVIVTAVGLFIIYNADSLPLLVIEGKGTTGLKNSIEYSICFIQFISMVLTLYHYYLEKSEEKLSIALALFYLLLTDLIFTIYESVYDIDNFAGHIFKALGFLFILKGYYFLKLGNGPSISEKVKKQRQLMNGLPGLIFQVIKKGDEFVLTFMKGELLQGKENYLGKSIGQVLPFNKVELNEYFRLAWRRQEQVIFELDDLDKSFLFSIKPLIESDDKEYIIGTVIEMKKVHRFEDEKVNVRFKVM